MPLYVYECESCHQRAEVLRGLAERDDTLICLECSSAQAGHYVEMKRVPTAASVDASAAASWRK